MLKISLLCKNTVYFRNSHLWVGKIGSLVFAEVLALSVGAKTNVPMWVG
ncbi:MAG TPA: hypothetical protein P5210_06460 [Draconibacterium sp.]|nr:hypothetical protein [Draconibacterium sp.]